MSTLNEAAWCVLIVTELAFPLGTVSWKATLPPAANATDAPKTRASAAKRQKRTRRCYREKAPRETSAKRRP